KATFQASAGFLTFKSYVNAGAQAPLLPAGSYHVVLHSDSAGFKDLNGNALVGDGTNAGSDYTASFDVAAAQYARPTFYLPQFAQGPTETVNVFSDTEL